MTTDELDRLLRGLARQRPLRRYFLDFFNGERQTVVHPEAVRRREGYYVFIGTNREHQILRGERGLSGGRSAFDHLTHPLTISLTSSTYNCRFSPT